MIFKNSITKTQGEILTTLRNKRETVNKMAAAILKTFKESYLAQ